ncbi:hypothetical protein CFK39_10950 [Brachybacterium avium]|uniref:Uncharacterized protein n=1 Tax=Brachybacterium avium TaxID=2017485 RepID=A0A220UE75_9MICO|nr:hypothetical protein CFK39_10950 [Brachybacterium avium]
MLTARGWADADEGTGLIWAVTPYVDRYRTTVLRPRRPDAQPLVLARTAPDTATGSTDLTGRDALVMGLVLGIGDPPVPVSTTPDCGCDACDSGSRDVLEELDRTILSIVDGSFETVLTPGWTSHRTSFGAGGGSGEEDADLDVTVTAQPWAENWTPRPLCPAIQPPRSSPVSAPRSRRPRRSTDR